MKFDMEGFEHNNLAELKTSPINLVFVLMFYVSFDWFFNISLSSG